MLRRRVLAVALVALAIAWLPLNDHVAEGPTLVTLSQAKGRGVTVADLLSVGLVLAAGWLWFG